MISATPLPDRFWAKVDQGAGCWEWTAHRSRTGYGRVGVARPRKTMLTHRLSWLIHNGRIDTGLHVLHRCDNPPCVRPDHLFLGTDADNHADMAAKGRSRRGALNGQAKLDLASVRQIRVLVEQGRTYAEVGEQYGVTAAAVGRIARRETWVWV